MNALDEDWNLLVGLLPPSWQRAARLSGAVERLREFDSEEELLRVLLMHVGCGYSLRETTVRARAAGLAKVCDVTLLNRLRQAEGWLQHLCQALLVESGVRWSGTASRRRLRALDGTVIKEPGPTGSHWRVHYSLRLPELACDQLVITSRKGAQTAENLERFPVAAGDLLLADRGYCHPAGVARVRGPGGDIIVRLNSSGPVFRSAESGAFSGRGGRSAPRRSRLLPSRRSGEGARPRGRHHCPAEQFRAVVRGR